VAGHSRGIPPLSRLNDQENLSTFAQTINSTFAQSPTDRSFSIADAPRFAKFPTIIRESP
jgi:hypothetical protein